MPHWTCSRRPDSSASLSAVSPGRSRLAELLRERDVKVAPRGAGTLVSFEVPDPPAFTERAAAEGLVVRGIPGRELARASVGAWNTGDEIERLAALASRP